MAEALLSDQLDLIERFIAAYNAIDRHLRQRLNADKGRPFTSLVAEYGRRHSYWRDREDLEAFADLRNVIEHTRVRPYEHIAIPVEFAVERMEQIRDHLTNPTRVIPKFQRQVTAVGLDDSLASILQVVREKAYSQFPVYDDERFTGILTENGITMWLAQHISADFTLVDLNDIPAREIMRSEEQREDYTFTAVDTAVDRVVELFAIKPMLETILITQHGETHEKLMGIITRWDVLHLR